VRDAVFKWIIVYGCDVPRGDAQHAIVGEALSGRHSCIAYRVTRYERIGKLGASSGHLL
jgi:hypothetical protein